MILAIWSVTYSVWDSVRVLRPGAVIHARIFECEMTWQIVGKAALLIRDVSTFSWDIQIKQKIILSAAAEKELELDWKKKYSFLKLETLCEQ